MRTFQFTDFVNRNSDKSNAGQCRSTNGMNLKCSIIYLLKFNLQWKTIKNIKSQFLKRGIWKINQYSEKPKTATQIRSSQTIKSIKQFLLETFWKHVFGSDNFLLWVSGNEMSLVSLIWILIIEYYFRSFSFSRFFLSDLYHRPNVTFISWTFIAFLMSWWSDKWAVCQRSSVHHH